MTSIASRAAAASPTRPWSADRVDQWPIERLIPYANNPRLHSAADVERIAASILKWGWTNPVLVDEQGVLIAGHGRVAAAAKLGLTVPIPVIVARGWSEEEKQAYRLADNELAARGSWDPDLLRSELGDLKFNGFDLDLIGFEPDRLEAILGWFGGEWSERSRHRPAGPRSPRHRIRRRLAVGRPPRRLRRQHQCGECRAGAGRIATPPDGERPALWRRL